MSKTEFLVLERNGAWQGDPAGAATIKKVYRIDLTGATDVSDPAERRRAWR